MTDVTARLDMLQDTVSTLEWLRVALGILFAVVAAWATVQQWEIRSLRKRVHDLGSDMTTVLTILQLHGLLDPSLTIKDLRKGKP